MNEVRVLSKSGDVEWNRRHAGKRCACGDHAASRLLQVGDRRVYACGRHHIELEQAAPVPKLVDLPPTPRPTDPPKPRLTGSSRPAPPTPFLAPPDPAVPTDPAPPADQSVHVTRREYQVLAWCYDLQDRSVREAFQLSSEIGAAPKDLDVVQVGVNVSTLRAKGLVGKDRRADGAVTMKVTELGQRVLALGPPTPQPPPPVPPVIDVPAELPPPAEDDMPEDPAPSTPPAPVKTPSAKQCRVPGCDRPQLGRGLCGAHVQQFRKHGAHAAYALPAKMTGRAAKTATPGTTPKPVVKAAKVAAQPARERREGPAVRAEREARRPRTSKAPAPLFEPSLDEALVDVLDRYGVAFSRGMAMVAIAAGDLVVARQYLDREIRRLESGARR